MATSRSGAGGKIVTNRRKQRLSATPYDRPPLPPPPPKSPNWFAGIIVPSARFLASGAGKIFNSIFSESDSSSSEDEDDVSEDDIDNENHYEIPCNVANTINERNATSSDVMHYGQDSQLNVWSSETKWTIEQLIMQETFSREECDKLIKVLTSRVTEAGEKDILAGSPGKMIDNDVDIFNKAVQEAKKWFQEKKVGSSSVADLAHGTSNLNSTGLEHVRVETGGGSPVDVARSYMKDRPPWSSPTRNVELRTPLTTTMKLFKERTLYSVGQDSLSSSKKRNSRVSGSWNIQEELRRVRSKATEDMLRTPSAKIDPSLFAVEPNRMESLGAGEVLFGTGEKFTETESLRKTNPIDALVDAGVSSDHDLAALQSRLDGKASEALSSEPVTYVSRNTEDSKAVAVEGEFTASKLHPSSPNHAAEHRTGPTLSDTNGVPATEVAEIGEKKSVNGLSSSQASLSAGVVVGQYSEQHDEKNNNADTVKDKKPANNTNAEGNCELLSEAYMEVPIVTETDSIASGSQSMTGNQYEELAVDMAQPSPEDKVDIVVGKQQARKPGRNSRRGRGRGK